MEGKDLWDPTAPEMLQEHMQRVNLVCRRCIAVLTEEADTQRVADARATAEAAAIVEAAKVAEFLTDNEDDAIWLDEPIWTEAYRIPLVNVRPPMPPPPGFGWGEGGFILGHGFAQLLVRPAL